MKISIEQELKDKGYKSTKLQTELINLLSKTSYPLSVPEILDVLNKKFKTLNKTTVYRQLETLVKENIVQELEFGDRKKRYEIDEYHHHHLVCNNCQSIQAININKFEEELEKTQEQISKSNQFQIKHHTLEFFGLCKDCQNL